MELQDAVTENLYPALFECFAIILCGYLAGRFDLLSKSDIKGLGTFVGTFALPSLIFTSLAKLDFSSVNWLFLASILLAKSIVFVLAIALTLFITRPIKLGRAGLFAIFCTQSNDFAIGYPIICALFSTTHPEYVSYLYLMAPISLIILNPIAFVLMEIGKQRDDAIPVEMRPKVKCEKLNMSALIIKGVLLNPIVAMTLLGMLGNIIFKQQLPVYIGGLLNLFGNAFTATALFLLGLKMVGEFHKLRGPALVLPGALIIAKLVILPLLMRTTTNLLLPPSNDTKALTDYAFLYGTIPTAPAVFVFSNQYKLDIDLIASSMVVCTFVSAPLMLVSAEMVGLTKDYSKQIARFETGVCAIAIVAAVWTLIVFTVSRKYLKQPHLTTICLVLTQLFLAIAALCENETLQSTSETWKTWITDLRIFFSYCCQLWIASIALILFLAQHGGTPLMDKVARWVGPPVAVLAGIALGVGVATQHDATASVLYLVCLLVTAISLVLLVRERRRHSLVFNSVPSNFAEDAGLIQNDPLSESNGYGTVNDEISDAPANERNEVHGREGHLGMLLVYAASMIVSISFLCWRAMSSEPSGVLVELEFVHVTLTFGQSLLPCAIFALKPNCIFGPIVRYVSEKWRRYRQRDQNEMIIPTQAQELDQNSD